MTKSLIAIYLYIDAYCYPVDDKCCNNFINGNTHSHYQRKTIKSVLFPSFDVWNDRRNISIIFSKYGNNNNIDISYSGIATESILDVISNLI